MQTSEINLPASEIKAPATDKPSSKREFLGYIHNYRGFIILFVVAAHVWLEWPEGSPIELLLRIIVENDTVMFIFLAGFLFQYLSKKFEYKDYLIKKFQNVILPYFLISIPILFYRLYTHDYGGLILRIYPEFGTYPWYEKVALYYLYGSHMIQLWFIPMIAIFYVLAPLWMYIDRHPKLYYLLIVFFIVSLLVPRTHLTSIPQMFVHFIFPYLFGMFASRYLKQYIEFSEKYWHLIGLAIVATITLNFIYADTLYGAFNLITKTLFCSYFLILMKKFEKVATPLLWKLGELSFGMYFVHYYFILFVRVAYPKYMGHEIPANLLYWFLYAAFAIAAAFYTVVILKKIFGKKSRFIVGC